MFAFALKDFFFCLYFNCILDAYLDFVMTLVVFYYCLRLYNPGLHQSACTVQCGNKALFYAIIIYAIFKVMPDTNYMDVYFLT